MKLYYDLTNNEISNYQKEFIKTPVGKKMNIIRMMMDTLWLVCLILSFIPELLNFSHYLFFSMIMIIIIASYEIYFNINFTAWLKNKYNIKRW